MQTFYRIEFDTPNFEKASYRSCHHCDAPPITFESIGLKSPKIFFKKEYLPKIATLQDCHESCKTKRLPKAILNEIMIPLEEVNNYDPNEITSDYFCFELDGVCCFDNLKDLEAHIDLLVSECFFMSMPKNGYPVIKFEGELVSKVYDGLVAKQAKLVDFSLFESFMEDYHE